MKNLLMLIAVTFSFTIVNAQNSVVNSKNAQSVSSKKSCGTSCTKSCCSKSASKKSCSSAKKASCSHGKTVAYSKLVSPSEFMALAERFPAEQIVDVRTKKEIKANGMIEGAINIDYDASYFKEEMMKLDKNAAVMVYCRSGARSGKAAMMLKQWGFTKIYDMDGGYNAYLKENSAK